MSRIWGPGHSATQKIFIYLLFSGSGISTYYFCRTIKLSKLPSLIAAIFYMANPFSITFIWPMRSLFILSYSLMPLVVGHFISIHNTNTFKIKNIIIHVLLVFILLTSAFSNPAILLIYFFAIGLYSLLHSFQYRNLLSIKILSLSIISLTFLSAFWLAPLLLSIKTEYNNASLKIESENDLSFLETGSKNVLDGFTLTGFWALSANYKGDTYFPWYKTFNSPIGKAIKYLPLIALITFAYYAPTKVQKIYSLLLILISILMLTGTKDLLPSLKLILFRNVPLLTKTFRSLETKFSPLLLLGFAPVFGAGITYLLSRKKTFLNTSIAIITILACDLYFGYLMFPVFNGDVIYPGGINYPSTRVSVPSYYIDARSWLDSQEDNFRILSLPLSTVYQIALKWQSGFVGTNPDRYLLGKSVLTNNTGINFDIPFTIAQNSDGTEEGLERVLKIAGLVNIKYILLHNDTNWDFIRDNKFWVQTSYDIFEKMKTFSKTFEFGKLSFLPIPNDYLNPIIYTPTQVLSYRGSSSKALDVFTSPALYNKNSLLLKYEDIQAKYDQNIDTQFAIIWGDTTNYKEKIAMQDTSLWLYDHIRTVNIVSLYDGDELYLIVNRIVPALPWASIDKSEILDSKSIKLPIHTTHVLINDKIFPILGIKQDLGIFYINNNGYITIKSLLENDSSILENGDFESGLWQESPDDCSIGLPGEKSFQQTLTGDAHGGLYSLALSSSGHSACVRHSLNVPTSTDIMTVKLNYKNIGDEKAKYCLWNSRNNKCSVLETLPSATSWAVYEKLLHLEDYNNMTLYLYTDSFRNNLNINYYDDIAIHSFSVLSNDNLEFKYLGWNQLSSSQKNINIDQNQREGNDNNLIVNGDFSLGPWQSSVNDCSAGRDGDPGIQMNYVFDKIYDRPVLELQSTNHLACTSQFLKSFEQERDYKISVIYKNIKGEYPQVCLWETSNNKCLFSEQLSKETSEELSDDWLIWTKYFTSGDTKTDARIFIYTDARYEKNSKNHFLSVSINETELDRYSIIVAIQKNTNDEAEYETSNDGVLGYKRNNSTYYYINYKYKKNNFLVFSQSFNTGWRAYVKKKGSGDLNPLAVLALRPRGWQVPEENHVVANGFANGWWIDPAQFPKEYQNPDGDYEIVLEFWPQRYFYLGLLISGLTLLSCLGYLVYDYLKHKRNQRTLSTT